MQFKILFFTNTEDLSCCQLFKTGNIFVKYWMKDNQRLVKILFPLPKLHVNFLFV